MTTTAASVITAGKTVSSAAPTSTRSLSSVNMNAPRPHGTSIGASARRRMADRTINRSNHSSMDNCNSRIRDTTKTRKRTSTTRCRPRSNPPKNNKHEVTVQREHERYQAARDADRRKRDAADGRQDHQQQQRRQDGERQQQTQRHQQDAQRQQQQQVQRRQQDVQQQQQQVQRRQQDAQQQQQQTQRHQQDTQRQQQQQTQRRQQDAQQQQQQAQDRKSTSELQSLMRISYAVSCLKKTIINYLVRLYTTTPTEIKYIH